MSLTKRYSIGDLERISDIKSHTIRIWEQRYCLLKPTRSDGNTRYYSEEDLMKLMQVSLLNKNGIRISSIAKMSKAELQAQSENISKTSSSFEQIIDSFLLYSINYDQNRLVHLFNEIVSKYGIEVTFLQVIFPFLRKVGTLWISGKITPGHEHFFSNLCRQKLFSVIDQIPPYEGNEPPIVLLQPEWDYHELGILFYNYLFRKNGFGCTYLGQAVPAADAVNTIETTGAKVAVCSFIAPTNMAEIDKYIHYILTNSPEVHLYLTGPHLSNPLNDKSERIRIFRSVEELKALLIPDVKKQLP